MPTVSALSPNGSTINNNGTVNFTWTYTAGADGAQTKYEIGYRRRAKEVTWTKVTVNTSSTTHTFAKDTFESGLEYEWYVVATGTTVASAAVRAYITVDSWTTNTEVSSSTASGTVDATSFTLDNYSYQVRVAQSTGDYGPWSTIATFAMGPASNSYIKVGGSMVLATTKFKVGGVWVDIPPIKFKTGGTFV